MEVGLADDRAPQALAVTTDTLPQTDRGDAHVGGIAATREQRAQDRFDGGADDPLQVAPGLGRDIGEQVEPAARQAPQAL